jgi:hypothetical protein
MAAQIGVNGPESKSLDAGAFLFRSLIQQGHAWPDAVRR